jgi:histidine triad (HIT) family protein
MASIFSRIISGEIPSYRIADNQVYYAFLDIQPIAKGHTLVVPRAEVDYIFDLDDDVLGGLHVFTKRVAHAIERAVPCRRVGMAVIGLEVPHAHVHLIPLQGMHDIDFSRPKLQFTPAEFEEIARSIRAHL